MASDEEILRRANGRLGTWLKGKYRLDAVLGIGGMAVVFRATHRNRAQFAVKMLHPELSLNADVQTRFLREGYAANTVNHPGAVLVVDDDVAEDGAAFLVMELLNGVTAEALLERNGHKLPGPPAVSLALQLLDVLSSAHTAGIVHRDVKPENLLVTRDGTVKVLDFGIARVLEMALVGGQTTGGGLPLGTPSYMAPEQAVGRSNDIDAQTDIWAAGATLFTLLSGKLVHDGPTPAQILVFSATRPAQRLAEVLPDVAPEIAAVVDRALSFEKQDRWPTAAAMRDALAAASTTAYGAAPSRDVLAALVPVLVSLPPSSLPEDIASAPTLHAATPTPGRKSTSAPVSSAQAPSHSPPARRVWSIVAGGVAAAALALGVAKLLPHVSPEVSEDAAAVPVAASGPVAVLIFDFERGTDDPVFEGSLECILDYALHRSSKIWPLSGNSLRVAAREVESGVAAVQDTIGPAFATHWGVRTVVARGKVLPHHAGASVELTLTDATTGKRLAPIVEEAETLDEVSVAMERVALRVRVLLGDPPADPSVPPKAGLSASLEAVHELVVTRANLSSGRSEDAAVHARRAVKIDPAFAEAHSLLGVALYNVGRRMDGQRELKEAMAHLDGLPEHRRAAISGLAHAVLQEYELAAPEFERLASQWPLEGGPRINAAETYLGMGDIPRALDASKRTLAVGAHWLPARAFYVRVELAAGQLDAVTRDAGLIIAHFPEVPPDLVGWLAVAEALQGHREAALEAYKKLETIDPQAAATAEADFAMFEGRLDDAKKLLDERLAREGSSRGELSAKAWAAVAELDWMRGDMRAAREAAEHVNAENDTETLFRAGVVLAHVGAAKLASEAASTLESRPGLPARVLSSLLRAELLGVGGHAKEALAAVEEAKAPGDFWLTHALLGHAELDAGGFEAASRELDACLVRTGEAAMAFLDTTPTLRYLPGVRFASAEARERLGRPDAKEAYEAFLAMEPASQNDPRAGEAKKRLARLH